jgi:hypothetical protein
MSQISLDYKSAHKYVREQRGRGTDVRWDGWDMVFWIPTRHGFTNKRGAFRNGRWGMESRVTVSNDGIWTVPAKKNVKHSR